MQALINGMWFFVRKRGDVKDFSLLSEPIFNVSSEKTKEQILAFSSTKDLIEIEDPSELNIKSKYDADRLFKLISIRKEIIGSRYREGYTDLVDLFFKLIQACETLKFLTLNNSPESEQDLTFIGKFSSFILEYSDETGSRSFSSFKSYVYAILNRSTDSPNDSQIDEAVTIQTIHQSKGLEYPVVFMPALVTSRIPGTRKDVDPIPFFKGVHKYWKFNNSFENLETDFIRVLYVGMTRAENLLYLSYFKRIGKAAKPSPYIKVLIENKDVSKIDFVVPANAIHIKNKAKDDKLRISSSHLQYYIFCPTRYKYALKHGVQAPHRGYFAFGSNLHSAIEEASNLVRTGKKPLNEAEVKELFNRHWNDYGFLNRGAASAQKKVAERRFVEFVDKHSDMLGSVIHSEKKFVLEEDNFILTGKIDAIAESENKNLVVVDFKTGERKKFEQEPESSFVKYQGNIYMEAVERTLGVTPQNYYLHFLGEDQKKADDYKWEFDVTPKSRKEVISILNNTVEKIKANDFTPNNDTERCKSCEFKNVCPFSSKKAA